MNELPLILGMMAVTFGVRYGVLLLVGRITLPQPAFRALKYVPPAVLAALIVPGVLMPDATTLNLTPANSGLVAAVLAILISWRTKNLLLTIIIGMGVYLVWRVLVSA